jgi:hypothetical protein
LVISNLNKIDIRPVFFSKESLVLNVRYFKAFVYFLNEKIIITGTSRGIGYELALKFAMLDKVLAISRKHLGF